MLEAKNYWKWVEPRAQNAQLPAGRLIIVNLVSDSGEKHRTVAWMVPAKGVAYMSRVPKGVLYSTDGR
jgi:hypothetical protein